MSHFDQIISHPALIIVESESYAGVLGTNGCATADLPLSRAGHKRWLARRRSQFPSASRAALVNPNGVARRLRYLAEHPSTAITMETVVCSKCGQRFAIRHDSGFRDVELAKKQAAWVTDLLVWDHIQERHHHGTTQLPRLQ